MSAAAINDRRMRAIEAGQDVASVSAICANAVEAAVEIATQVKITGDIIDAALGAAPLNAFGSYGRAMLIAGFAAAGFEVVK